MPRALPGLATLATLWAGPALAAEPITGCSSKQINAAFADLGRTGKLAPEVGRWVMNTRAQYEKPYRAFDNVYFVGVCWVSAWIIKTSDGAVLIDTLHEPHVDQLIKNIAAVGVKPADIKYVLITHGHFDHAGGAYKLKPLLTNAKFVMTQAGWNEAIKSAKASQGTPRAWTMIPQDVVAKDGDVFKVGDESFGVLVTPGHTWGTASYTYDVKDNGKTYHAITVGGLGLNAIENSKQVEAYINSVNRIEAMVKRPDNPITVHLTTHPFSTGLTEAKDRLATRKPGDPNPLIDTPGFLKQLADLRKDAEARLVVERKAGR
jgi:metallo-beta-lactamase class B